MKNAWIENDIIRDVAPGNPAECYHPAIAIHYDTDVPDDVLPGARLVDGAWVNPAPVETVVPEAIPPKVSPVEFKLLFSAQERVAITAARASDPVIDDFYTIVEDPRLTHVDLGLQSTRDAIDYLIAQELVDAARREAILSGVLQ